MATIRADKLNPHDIVIIDGQRVKVVQVTRLYHPVTTVDVIYRPVTAVDVIYRDAAKARAPKVSKLVAADFGFEYVGDARLI
ncbi:hypothetical protein [Burkholderia phage BCSR129]|nr:hypothetical protein [Burkholderia phage BCSR129]